jgi:hypothetical protein
VLKFKMTTNKPLIVEKEKKKKKSDDLVFEDGESTIGLNLEFFKSLKLLILKKLIILLSKTLFSST